MKVIDDFLSLDDMYDLTMYAEDRVFEEGRQGTGYERVSVPDGIFHRLRYKSLWMLGIFDHDTSHDCYLIRYRPGSYIPRHTDDSCGVGIEHHRFNAIVSNGYGGGELVVDDKEFTLVAGQGYAFRPDIEPHEVKPVVAGVRLVWSVGCLL